MKTSKTTLWDTLRTSYWFVPSLMVLASVALWIMVFLADRKISYDIGRIWWLYTGGPEGARSLLSALIGAMITVAGVVFSITIVVLTLASQQFGPLLLRNFVRDKGSQIVLGTFVATFVFCLLVLRTVREGSQIFVPQVSVTTGVALGIASIGVLVYFIHHIAVFIQAPYLIEVVYEDLDQSIDRIFPEKLGAGSPGGQDEEQRRETEAPFNKPTGIINALDRGYVKEIDSKTLLETAVEHDIAMRLTRYPGDFLVPGAELARVLPPGVVNDELTRKINDAFIVGSQRTASQDLDFLFSQLVEIAVRALSPGINDPFTAVICIDYLSAAFCKLAGRALPSPFRVDKDGKLRVIAFPVTFVRMVDTAFGSIRYYGRTHPSVLARLLGSVSVIARLAVRKEDREALIRQAYAVRQSVIETIQSNEERMTLLQEFNRAAGELALTGAEKDRYDHR